MALSKGVYSKDDGGRLTIKDSNHKRRSKQNTYHVVNKNIAPSKVTDRSRRKRGCLPGHPQALAFRCPQFILGVAWASPSLGFCHSLSHSPSKLYPKLENFTTQNLTELREMGQYDNEQINHLGTVKTRLIIIFIQCLLYLTICTTYITQYNLWKHQNKQTMH